MCLLFSDSSSCESILDQIGSTPLVSLRRVPLSIKGSPKIFVKLEYRNPSGSIKDRVALSVLNHIEKTQPNLLSSSELDISKNTLAFLY
jgi:threonine synthase